MSYLSTNLGDIFPAIDTNLGCHEHGSFGENRVRKKTERSPDLVLYKCVLRLSILPKLGGVCLSVLRTNLTVQKFGEKQTMGVEISVFQAQKKYPPQKFQLLLSLSYSFPRIELHVLRASVKLADSANVFFCRGPVV